MGIEHLLGSLSFGMAVHSVGSIYYTFKGDFSPSDIGVLALYGVEFLGALGAGFLGRCANGSQKLKDEVDYQRFTILDYNDKLIDIKKHSNSFFRSKRYLNSKRDYVNKYPGF